MKVSFLIIGALGIFASAASAAPVCIAGGTMASYVALGNGGCTIGNLLFSNFVYGSTGHQNGIAVSASEVFLDPVNIGTYNPGPGIVFSSSGWFVNSASLIDDSYVDSSIAFDVSVVSGAPIIKDGTLILGPYSALGTGLADIAETLTPQGGSGLQLQVDSGGPFTANVDFTPVNRVHVLKDLFIFVPQGEASGSARINSFEEDFSEAPEPVSTALIGSGLVALGFWRRRSMQRS
jgi:hypothetical protein